MESERLRNSLLAAISHDLRTPLSALVGLAESLHDDAAPAFERPSSARSPTRSATRRMRMNALVNNLLDMARLQAGRVRLQPPVAAARGSRRQRAEGA